MTTKFLVATLGIGLKVLSFSALAIGRATRSTTCPS
jgi:hypothetical protein